MTAPVFRSVCQHTGDVAPNPVPDELVTLRLENMVLRERVRELETLLAVARAERDTARATGTVGIR